MWNSKGIEPAKPPRLEVRNDVDLVGWVDWPLAVAVGDMVRGFQIREVQGGFGSRWLCVHVDVKDTNRLTLAFHGLNFRHNRCPISVDEVKRK